MKQISDNEIQRHKCQLVQIPAISRLYIFNNQELATHIFGNESAKSVKSVVK